MTDEDCYKNGIGSVEKCNEGINACLKITVEEGKLCPKTNLVLEEIFHSSSDQEVQYPGFVEQIKAGTQRSCAPIIGGFEQLIEDGVCKEMNIGDLTPDLTPRVCFCKSELCNGSGKFNDSIITISILVFVSYLMK